MARTPSPGSADIKSSITRRQPLYMTHTPFPFGNPTQVYRHKGWGFLVPHSYPRTAHLLICWFPAVLLQLGDLVYPSTFQLLQWTFPLTNLSDTNFQNSSVHRRPSQHPPHICGSAAETALPFLTAYTQTLVWKDAEPQPRGGQGCRAPADTARLWAPRTQALP